MVSASSVSASTGPASPVSASTVPASAGPRGTAEVPGRGPAQAAGRGPAEMAEAAPAGSPAGARATAPGCLQGGPRVSWQAGPAPRRRDGAAAHAVRGGTWRAARGAGRHGRGRVIRAAVQPVADLAALATAVAVTGAGLARGSGYCAAAMIAFAAAGLYRLRVGQRVSDQAGRIAVAAMLPSLALAAWSAPGQALLLGGCATGLVITARMAAAAELRTAYRRGMLVRRTLIIGGGSAAGSLARLLRQHPELGLRVSGAVDNHLPADQPGGAARLPLLGRLDQARAVISGFDIAQVLVCFPAATEAELTAALRSCREAGVAVSVLPRLPGLGLAVPRYCLDEIWGVPLIPLRADAAAPARRTAKRLLDLTAGLALLAVSAPLLALLSLAVRADLRLPALFRQVRVTGRGRLATITKLRTLRPDGDPDTTWVIPDGQCSPVGSMLRATHADELPQLASVVRGDMSLVGPRPERPHFARRLAREVAGYRDRERVRAGLTGWAQVHGLTGDTSIADRARFDNFYIEYGSVWLDLLILARTLPAALSGALHTLRGGTR